MTTATQQIRFCLSDGIRIAYAISGEGPPIVKAASYITHLEHDWTSPTAQPWLTALNRTHTLVRYDERGTGLSDWDVNDVSFEGWVHDLEAVVTAAGLHRFALLGISQGGSIATAYAVRHPERVSHLILHGAFARGRLRRNPTPQQVEEAETMAKLAELGWGRDNPAFRAVFTMQLLPGGTQEQHRAFNDMQRLSASPQMAARMMRTFDRLDVSELAPRVRCPTLVTHARDDGRVPFEEGRRIASMIPGARFVPLETANHIPLEGEPALAHFLREIEEFLAIADDRGAPPLAGLSELTAREREVLERVAEGLANDEIAHDLSLSPKTVRNHVTRIFDKLQVTTRAQAIVRARDSGLGRDRRGHDPAP